MTPSSEVFQRIRPFCMKVAEEPSLERLKSLKEQLLTLQNDALKEGPLLEYILFPLKLGMKKNPKQAEDTFLATVDCISLALTKTLLQSRDIFFDLFNMCCILLSSRTNSVAGPNMIVKASEEFKLSLVSLLTILCKQSSCKVFCDLYTKKHLPSLGHAVSLQLSIAEFEQNRELRWKALQCLQYMLGEHKKLTAEQTNLNSAAFSSFIPGISMTLTRIVSGDQKTGHRIIASALDTWSQLLLLVMGDKNFEFLMKKRYTSTETSELLKFVHQARAKGETKGIHNASQEVERELQVNRSKEWMQKTSSNLRILIERVLTNVILHHHLKIKLAAIRFAKVLITECTNSMSDCLPLAVEMLASFMNDDYVEVVKESEHALQGGQIKLCEGSKALITVLEENLLSKLLTLPRIMHSAGDEKKLFVLNLISGYLNLIGYRISSILNSSVHLDKLMKALLQVTQLDVSDVKIVEERTPVTPHEVVSSTNLEAEVSQVHKHKDWKRFKCFADEKIYRNVALICKLIGKYSNLDVIVDYLLDVLQSSSMHRKEALLLLNEILFGATETSQDHLNVHDDRSLEYDIEQLMDQLVSMYILDDYWYLPTCNTSESDPSIKEVIHQYSDVSNKPNRQDVQAITYFKDGLSFENINNNIQLICLLIEGLANCSVVLKKRFEVYFARTLYPLLEKLANENANISTTAFDALITICKNCGYPSVASLISSNADYLVHSIQMNLRHLVLLSSAPDVLSVMLTYSNEDVLPLVSDVLQDVFDALDSYQEEVAYSLMRVLRSLAVAVKTWFADKENPEADDLDLLLYRRDMPFTKRLLVIRKSWQLRNIAEEDTYCNCGLKQQMKSLLFGLHNNDKVQDHSPKKLCDFFVDYCKTKQEASGEVDTEDDLASEERQADTKDKMEEEELKTPQHFQAVITALKKCSHFLPADSISLKLLVLDVVENGVLALRHRQNDLLPLVHKLWPAMVQRLKDPKQVIAMKTLNVICTMVNCSEDFMRQRIRKDVLPTAIAFLQRQSEISHKSLPVYKFSQMCKLQTKALNFIGTVVSQLKLTDEDFYKAASVCSVYLDCRQPQVLQETSIQAIKQMQNLDRDAVWFMLTSLYSPTTLARPNSAFITIEIPEAATSRNEYSDNVMKIFNAKDSLLLR